jgi:hypothetical protein
VWCLCLQLAGVGVTREISFLKIDVGISQKIVSLV